MLTAVFGQVIYLNLEMQKSDRLLTAFCVLLMALLLSLQAYWIAKYYRLTKQNFEKEVSFAFEDAVKKEFSIRADTIEQILKKKLLDTNSFIFTSKVSKIDNRIIYNLISKKDSSDKFISSVSFADLNVPIEQGNPRITEGIVERFVRSLRSEDLENHIVYFRTQELGKFMVDITNEIEFDTLKLRPVLDKYLAERGIFVDYNFYTATKDSTTNKSTFNPVLLKKFPVITKSIPTYRKSPGQNYVRAMFKDPFTYILSNMWLILSSSLLLVGLIGFCLNHLLKSLNREKKLSMIKNDFISNITHEFKTPIATALVAIEALSDDTVEVSLKKKATYLSYAKNELNRLSMLTDKILKLALYNNGNHTFKKESIDVELLIREIVEIHSLSSKSSKINFENQSDKKTVFADKTQFQHALSNVIENAIKYGGEEVNINIICYVENNHFVVSVKDNGPGIASTDIPFVFEKFYRVKHQKKIKGYGLGLNYVKQIMEHHTGWYKIISTDEGTELKLGWPTLEGI